MITQFNSVIKVYLLFSLLSVAPAVAQVIVHTDITAQERKHSYVVGAQTDELYANKTTIYTKKGVSDAKVLEEISDEYSLGDEVRITVGPPPQLAPQKIEVPIIERVVIVSEAPTKVAPSVFSIEQVLSKPEGTVLNAGSIIRAEHFQFAKDAADIDPTSYQYLDEVVNYLTEHPRVIFEIGGHTNMIPSHEYCMTLSVQRAQAVVSYLTNKGISSSRLRARGYGKTQPLVIATSEAANKANQRVEFKVFTNN